LAAFAVVNAIAVAQIETIAAQKRQIECCTNLGKSLESFALNFGGVDQRDTD